MSDNKSCHSLRIATLHSIFSEQVYGCPWKNMYFQLWVFSYFENFLLIILIFDFKDVHAVACHPNFIAKVGLFFDCSSC